MRKILFLFFICILAFVSNADAAFYNWRERHATDCTALTDGSYYDMCRNTVDPFLVYQCNNSSGCTTSADWAIVGGGASGDDSQIQFNDGGSLLGAASTFVYKKTSGNFGIGTFNPLATLDVVGSIKSTDDNSYLEFGINLTDPTLNSGKGNLWMGSDEHLYFKNSLGTIDFNTAAAAQAWASSLGTTYLNTSSDNVGIGTATGQGKLYVVSANFPVAYFERSNADVSSAQSAVKLRHKSTGTAIDGFGTIESYYMQDDSGTDGLLGEVGYVRAGADNTGDLIVRPSIAGTSSEVFRITSAGTVRVSQNVGIGTITTPRGSLEVFQGAGTYVVANQNAVALLNIQSAFNTAPSLKIDNTSGAPLVAMTKNTSTPVLHVVNSGNIGVGSSNPGQTLDVQGTVRMTEFRLTGNGASAGNVLVTNSVGLGTWMSPSSIGASSGGGGVGIGTVNTGTAGFLTYYPSTGTTVDDTSLFSNGTNLGIGTSNVSTAALTVLNGNVGIGTWVPGGGMHVKGASFPPLFLERTTTNTTGFLSAYKLRVTTTGSASDGFGIVQTFSMLDSSGTDSELGSLGFVRANGTDNTADFIVNLDTAGTANERLRVTYAGNVGISSASPGQALDVNGNVRATGYRSSDNSPGVTVTTCTSFKNGLCVAGS